MPEFYVYLITGGINLTGVTVQRPAVTQLLQQQIAQRALQQHIQVQLQQQQQHVIDILKSFDSNTRPDDRVIA